ncbi:MAG: flippase, partial [Thermodesulfobacteriota bacterium]
RRGPSRVYTHATGGRSLGEVARGMSPDTPTRPLPPAPDPPVARNTVLNLVGNGAPMLVALVAIPLLVKGIGTERFGVLTLAWMVVGYFSLFDLGIGRALTKFVAERLARGQQQELPALVWTSLYLMLALGALGGAAAAALTPALVNRVLNIPPALVGETTASFYLVALCVPLVLVTTGLRGVLEGQQRFGLVNAIKIPANAANFLLPLAALPFTESLVPVVGLLVAGRAAVLLAHLACCLGSLPGLRRPVRPEARHVAELLRFGAWLTVSNVVSPLMSYMDRFFIGAFLTLQEVAFYVTPYELVTKLILISLSLQTTLFPAFTSYAATGEDRLRALHGRALVFTLMVYTPVVSAVVVLAEPFLALWLGGEFPLRSAAVMQLLAVGVLVNAVGSVPYSAIQAMGRADLTAKVHLLQVPAYVAMLLLFTRSLGIEGAALAWTLRLVLDTAVWLWLARTLLRTERAAGRVAHTVGAVGGALAAAGAAAALPGLPWKLGALFFLVAGTCAVSWRYGLTGAERAWLKTAAARWRPARRTLGARKGGGTAP